MGCVKRGLYSLVLKLFSILKWIMTSIGAFFSAIRYHANK